MLEANVTWLVLVCLSAALRATRAQPVLGDVSLYDSTISFDPFPDLPADFGPDIPDEGVDGLLMLADPEDACDEFSFVEFGETWVALIARAQRPHPTNCTFDIKVRNAERAGAAAAIVYDDAYEALIIMSKPFGNPEPGIPSVFVSAKAGLVMRKLLVPGQTRVRLTPVSAIAWMSMVMSAFLGFLALTVVIATFYVMRSWSAWLGRTRSRRGAPGELTYMLLHGPDAAGMSSAAIRALPMVVYVPRAGRRRPPGEGGGRRGAGGEAEGAEHGLRESLLPAAGGSDDEAAGARGSGGSGGDLEQGRGGADDGARRRDQRQRQKRRRRDQRRGCEGGAGVPATATAAAAGGAEAGPIRQDGAVLLFHAVPCRARHADDGVQGFSSSNEGSEDDGRSRSGSCSDVDGESSDGSGDGPGTAGAGTGAAALPPGCRGGATRRTCVICLEHYRAGDKVSVLPCAHRFHGKCVGSWLSVRRFCPVCKRDASEPPAAAPEAAAAAPGGAPEGARAPAPAGWQGWLLSLGARLRRAAAVAEAAAGVPPPAPDGPAGVVRVGDIEVGGPSGADARPAPAAPAPAANARSGNGESGGSRGGGSGGGDGSGGGAASQQRRRARSPRAADAAAQTGPAGMV